MLKPAHFSFERKHLNSAILPPNMWSRAFALNAESKQHADGKCFLPKENMVDDQLVFLHWIEARQQAQCVPAPTRPSAFLMCW